jgi:hypothetical protein
MREVEFNADTREKIAEAVKIILEGKCARIIINDKVNVYECKNVIRIDLKITGDK